MAWQIKGLVIIKKINETESKKWKTKNHKRRKIKKKTKIINIIKCKGIHASIYAVVKVEKKFTRNIFCKYIASITNFLKQSCMI